jgi:Rrf2 family nitric oxide-sensitive transcriptional repressor
LWDSRCALAIRGRSGGLVLGCWPDAIRTGDAVRLTKPDFAPVECFVTGNQCVLTRSCKLSGMLGEAMASFHSPLDRYTLADIALMPADFIDGPPPSGPSVAEQAAG